LLDISKIFDQKLKKLFNKLLKVKLQQCSKLILLENLKSEVVLIEKQTSKPAAGGGEA
jgi:hypothetical protein